MASHRADIVLLDDPFSALDGGTANHVFSHGICGLLKEKLRILSINSHLHLLPQFDRVIVLQQGIIVADGTPADLALNYPDILSTVLGNSESESESENESQSKEIHIHGEVIDELIVAIENSSKATENSSKANDGNGNKDHLNQENAIAETNTETTTEVNTDLKNELNHINANTDPNIANIEINKSYK